MTQPRAKSDLEKDILNVDEAAELLGVSVKTFNKVLHSENVPARKVGREWKFSRRALIEWVGSGRSQDFYSGLNGHPEEGATELEAGVQRVRARRTAGWDIDMS